MHIYIYKKLDSTFYCAYSLDCNCAKVLDSYEKCKGKKTTDYRNYFSYFHVLMFKCKRFFQHFFKFDFFCGLVSLNSLFCMSDLQLVVKFCLQGLLFHFVCYGNV